jgi:hypothetical protein
METDKLKGGNKPNRAGRPKGSVNRTTKSAKEAIQFAADGLGGASRLIAWAQEDPSNERVFWGTIYPKLLPLTVGGDQDNPIKHDMTFRVSFESPDN